MVYQGFPGGSMVENPPANAGEAGSGRPLEKEMTTHASILAWETPWTEKPGRVQSVGSLRVSMTEHAHAPGLQGRAAC